jgi:hypothetical protein
VKPHVSEDALVALATPGGGLSAADEEARMHVDACPDCADRLGALTRILADVRSSAIDEADEIFTIDRLERQRDHILHRIDVVHDGRPARVIEFPHRAAQTPRPMRPIAVRWVAAAAAAGLVIGVYAGSHMNGVGQPIIRDSHLSRLSAPAVPGAQESGVVGDVKTASDEEVLSEIETALLTQRAAALEPIDALTPRARPSEIELKIR